MVGAEDVNAEDTCTHVSKDEREGTCEVETQEFAGLNFGHDVQEEMKQLVTEAKDVADKMFDLENTNTLFLDSAKDRADGQGHKLARREQLKGQGSEFKSKMTDLESQAKDLEGRLVQVLLQRQQAQEQAQIQAQIQAAKHNETVMELTQTIKNFELRVVQFEAEANLAQEQFKDAVRSKDFGEERAMELEVRYSLLEQAASETPNQTSNDARTSSDDREVLLWEERLEENEARTATLVHQLNAEFRQCELKSAQECHVLRRQLAERDLKLTERNAALRNSIAREQFDLIQMRHDNLQSTVSLTNRKCIGTEEEFAKMKLLLDLEVARTSTAEDALQAQKKRAEIVDCSLQRIESSSGGLKDESAYFKTRAEVSEHALAELQVQEQEQAYAVRISTEALEARQQKHLALEISEAKVQDSIARLQARVEESIRAEKMAEAKASSLAQHEAVALLDAKTCQQVALETELQAEATKTQGTKELLRRYEDDINQKTRESSELREMVQKLGRDASVTDTMTTTLEAEKEELFAERDDLNVQLSMLKKKLVALTLQEREPPQQEEREPPQQVLCQQQATMPFIRSVPLLVSQSPGVSPLPMQGHTTYVWSPSPPVQTCPLMQSARVVHVSEVARMEPVDTNIAMTAPAVASPVMDTNMNVNFCSPNVAIPKIVSAGV